MMQTLQLLLAVRLMFNWTGQVSNYICNWITIKRKIYLPWDCVDQQVAQMLQRRFFEAFEDFGKDFVKSCDQQEEAATLPVTVHLFSYLFSKFFYLTYQSISSWTLFMVIKSHHSVLQWLLEWPCRKLCNQLLFW